MILLLQKFLPTEFFFITFEIFFVLVVLLVSFCNIFTPKLLKYFLYRITTIINHWQPLSHLIFSIYAAIIIYWKFRTIWDIISDLVTAMGSISLTIAINCNIIKVPQRSTAHLASFCIHQQTSFKGKYSPDSLHKLQQPK